MLMEIGANKIKTKATHFFSSNIAPIKTSSSPTTGNMYPVAFNELINSAADPVAGGSGIKCKNLLLPKITSTNPNTILTSKVNFEFINK